ncbi:MAG TPA: amidohydrolase family protein [Myxococcales bacterium]|nr:amidohydrolase family protein [Myxococcales bacterium]
MRWMILAALAAIASPSFAEVVVLKGARLIDGTGRAPVANAVLVIDGDRIAAVGAEGKVKVPQGARVIHAKGRTVMPGLINAHGHAGLVVNGQNKADGYTKENVQAQLVLYEQYGVTSVLSLGLNRDLGYEVRDEQRAGNLPGASLFLAGRGIGVPDAAPPVPVAPDQCYRPKTVEEAVADVRETASHHADYLKLWVDDIFGKFPKMDPAVYKAAIAEAHKDKLRVASHIFYLADARSLIADGVDALAHSIRDQPVDAALIGQMKKQGTYYVATLDVDQSFFDFLDDPTLLDDPFLAGALSPEVIARFRSPEWRDKAKADPNMPKVREAAKNGRHNVVALQKAGVHIAFGTDSGANPLRIPGWAEHRELELLVKAGLTPMQALVAATRGSAAMLGLKDRGTLEKGKRADLLVLAEDPLQDIRNTRKLVSIFHGGREVRPGVEMAAR